MDREINKLDITFNEAEKYPLFSKIYLFYQNSEMNLNSEYQFYKENAVEFLGKVPIEDQDEIKKNTYMNFFEKELFICSENMINKDDFYYHIFGFQNFYRTLNNVIDGYEPRSFNDQGAERKPENFFRYMKEQKKQNKNKPLFKASYSLLFE